MEVGETQEEWELSKENVQPLRNGRKFANLSMALQPNSGDQMDKLKQMVQEYETELRTYSGDDPLDVWIRYINWTEQNFPKGGKESNLSQILAQCVSKFKDEEKYKNDVRYLEVWIKFAMQCSEPLEIFSFLFNQKIGSKLAQFYTAWAWELEQVGNYKKADTIFSQGDELGAQPLDLLRRRHREFQARVAKQTVLGTNEQVEQPSVQASQQRLALGVLKGKSKTGAVPVDRAGTSHSALQGGLKLDNSQSGNKQKSNQFSVFADENSAPALPPQSGEYAHIPSNKMHRENTQQPGVWKNVKVKQKSLSTIKISEVSSQANPTFNVFHDEGGEQPMKTPKKVNPEVNNQVLSAKKPSKSEDPFYNIQQMHHQQQDPSQRPMYCKALIYNGCKEFSFEELRALQWRKEEKTRIKMKEKEELLEQKYREIQEREQHVQRQFEELQEKQRLLELNREKVVVFQDNDLAMATEPNRPMIRQNSGGRMHVPAVIINSDPNQSHTPVSDLSSSQLTNSSQQLKPVHGREPTPLLNQSGLLLSSKDSGDSQPSFSVTGGGAGFGLRGEQGKAREAVESGGNLNVTNQTPSFNCSLSSGLGSGAAKKNSKITPDSSFLRTSLKGTPRSGSLTAPSPTVNTKEAMQVVMGMFNRTLEIDNNFGWGKSEQANDFEAVFAESNNEPPAAARFQIFTDSSDRQVSEATKSEPSQQPEPAGPVFTIFTDDQNPSQMDTQTSKSTEDVIENKVRFTEKQNSASVTQSRVPRSSFGGPTQMDSVSSNVYHLPMPSEESEVTEMVDAGNIYTKPAPDIEMDYDCDELTFMPKFSSTINFTQAAQLASTPFNMLHEVGSLPAPPVSTIKPQPADAETSVSNPSAPAPLPEQTTMFGDMDRNGASNTESSHQVSTEAGNCTEGVTEQDSSVSAQNRRSSAFAAKAANLSPIMEQSDEDAKSQGSSLGSNSTAHSNVFAANNTHHMSQSVQGKDQHATRLSSVEEEPSKLSHSVRDSSTRTEVPPPTESLEVSMKRGFRQLEGVGNMTMHEIDISNYVPAEPDERTERMLNMSVAIEDNDPFDENVISRFLSLLKKPLESYDNYHISSENMPQIQLSKAVALGENIYNFDSLMGEGAYAKVYKANLMVETEYEFENEEKVIKVQNPACPWEFYITSELHDRLTALQMPYDTRGSVMHVDHCYIYSDGSCLVSDLHKHGTLLDLVNLHTRMKKNISQGLVMLIGIEMLHLAEQLQKCNIIHGDIKPDNFLVTEIPDVTDSTNIEDLIGGRSKIIKLIDFGRSIDLTMYPSGTSFTTKVETSGFQCIEMKTDQPWTYQTDLFGIIGSLHVLLFGDYMKVYQENRRWRIIQVFRRYHWGMDLWKRLFDKCLNIPSCEELPDIVSIRREMEKALKARLSQPREFKTFVNSLKDLSIMYWEA